MIKNSATFFRNVTCNFEIEIAALFDKSRFKSNTAVIIDHESVISKNKKHFVVEGN